MREFVDQMQRSVRLPWPPRRIISLVPSQTELLFDLGLGEHIVGVTDFCTEPAQLPAHCQRIGGTKRFRFEQIAALQPDLIIGNLEENYEEGITRLAAQYPVWMSDILTIDDSLQMIRGIGEVVDRAAAAMRLADAIDAAFATLTPCTPLRVAYLIWKKPWMAAAAQTFIDDMLQRAGFLNVFAQQSRYPEFTLEHLQTLRPEVLMLSSEPFPFDAAHVAELAPRLPDCRVLVVDAMPFSWYGSRLLAAPAYFAALRDELSAPRRQDAD
jgi:ABC-type Fe3+-hydroxamate transport system substrate-binding protein